MLSFEKLDPNADGAISREEFEKVTGTRPGTGDKEGWQIEREAKAKGYLEDHGLVNFMQFLLQSLMIDKPADPYSFIHKQAAMKAAQMRLANSHDKELESLLNKLDPEVSEAATMEQLAELERQALEAGTRLRTDNEMLLSTAADLRTEYERLLKEGAHLSEEASGKMNLPSPSSVSRAKAAISAGDSQQVQAYKEIMAAQAEVCDLAKENSGLVQKLLEMRRAVDAVRGDLGAATAAATA